MCVGVCNSYAVFSSNLVYETPLSFAFIQIMKCFSPVTVLLVGLAFGAEMFSPRVAAALAVVTAGTMVTVNGELAPDTFGILLMLSGIGAEALRLVCSQLLLHGLKLPVMDGIIVMYPPTLLLLLLIFAATEYDDMMASGKHRMIWQNPGIFVACTTLGACVNALSVALVSLTSGLTIKLLARGGGGDFLQHHPPPTLFNCLS